MFNIFQFYLNKKGIVVIEYALIALVIASAILFSFSSDSGFILELTKKFDSLAESLNDLTK